MVNLIEPKASVRGPSGSTVPQFGKGKSESHAGTKGLNAVSSYQVLIPRQQSLATGPGQPGGMNVGQVYGAWACMQLESLGTKLLGQPCFIWPCLLLLPNETLCTKPTGVISPSL